jgi:hypothetical protein
MLLMFGVLALGGASPHDDDIATRFHSEYPGAAARLEEAYSHVRILSSETRHDNDGKFLWTMTAEFLREGDAVRGVKTVSRSASPDVANGAVSAQGGTGAKSFDLFKTSNSVPFVFHQFGPVAEFDEDVRMKYPPLFAPFCALEIRVADFIRKPNVKLASASATRLGTQEVVEALVDELTPDQGVKRHRFMFQPTTWALAGWRIALNGDKRSAEAQQVALHGVVTYEPAGNPPKVKTVENWGSFPSKPRVKVDRRRYDVSRVEFGPLDKELFTLAAFGIEEPALPGAKRRGRFLWSFVALLTLLLAIGARYYVVARRQSRASAGKAIAQP